LGSLAVTLLCVHAPINASELWRALKKQGETLELQNRYGLAAITYQKCLQEIPKQNDSARALLETLLATAYVHSNRPQEAKPYVADLVSIVNRTGVAGLQPEFMVAVKDLTEACDSWPREAPYEQRGQVYHEQYVIDVALAALDRKSPDAVDDEIKIEVLLSDEYKNAADYSNAVTHAKKCLDLLTAHPRDSADAANVSRLLIDCLRKLHRDKEANAIAREFAEKRISNNNDAYSDFLTDEEKAAMAKVKSRSQLSK